MCQQILNYDVKTTNYRRKKQMWNNQKRYIKKNLKINKRIKVNLFAYHHICLIKIYTILFTIKFLIKHKMHQIFFTVVNNIF